MKIAIISDIHGNDSALEAVLRDPVFSDASEIFVLGDFVGYYYRPARVLELLANAGLPLTMIQGNHEGMLLNAQSDTEFLEKMTRRYGSGLRVALGELSSAQLATLGALPSSLEVKRSGRSIILCHGAPWNRDAYVYPDAGDEVWRRFEEFRGEFIFMGHTHRQMIRPVGGKVLVNVGSVGQPRDRGGGASWALFDSESGEVKLVTTVYSTRALEDMAKERDPHLPYLWEVLGRGVKV